MTATSSEEIRAAADPTLLDRALAAYPVALLYFGLSILYGWQASKHVAPYVFSDELQWSELSRSIWQSGHAELRLQPAHANSVYAYVMAPAWWFGDVARSYEAMRYIGTLLMTASVIPAYLLARSVVRWHFALFAAAATATIPALIYSALLIPESIAYPYCALCYWAVARALVLRAWPRVVVAAVLVLGATTVRGELIMLVPAMLVACVVYAATSVRGRRLLASWTARERCGAAALVIGLGIFLNAAATHTSDSWQIGTHFGDRMLDFGTWAAGAFAIGVGILPVVATLAWILRFDQRRPEERALLAVSVGAIPAFLVYTAVKASYLSTNLADLVEERNLIYLSPLVFVVTALWLSRLRMNALTTVVASAATVYLIVATPYHLDQRLYSDAPGLAILAAANRSWAWNQGFAENVLVGITIGAGALLMLVELLRRWAPRALERPEPIAIATTAVALAVLAWTITAERSAADASRAFSEAAIANLPRPPSWVDARTSGERTLYVGQRINQNLFYPLKFWNASIGEVWSLDATAPPPGPTVTPNLAGADGAIVPQRDVRWVIGDNGVSFVGRVVERHGATTLYRVRAPLRIATASSGVYDDGWIGQDASFARYAAVGRHSGVARLTLSRAGATGSEPRTIVTVRLGTVRVDVNGQPRIGRVRAMRRLSIGGREVKRVELRATPPYRIEVHVARTFRPIDFGGSDARELGVQASSDFVPSPRS